MPPTTIESTPRLLIPHARQAARARRFHLPAPPCGYDARGLSIVVDDGDRTLAYSGYRLYVESDRYLLRVWDRITNDDLVDTYIATLTGVPCKLIWKAFGLRSWEEARTAIRAGLFGHPDARVDPLLSIAPLVAAGRLLPYP